MKLDALLKRYQFPQSVLDILSRSGIQDLYPPQADAINKGILEGKNFVLAVPTASGKTLMAELCMLKEILQNNGRCLYVAPLKALVAEKYDDFKQKYAPLGLRIHAATGDDEQRESRMADYQIMVTTAEKMDALLRTRTDGLINNLSLVVLDEIHFINDDSRGPTLEILIARLKQLNPDLKILGLSATISNAAELADWLKAEHVVSDWRPIPLKEGVYYKDTIFFDGDAARLVKEQPDDDLNNLTVDSLRGKGQVLIFTNSRRSAEAAGREVSPHVSLLLSAEEKTQLEIISRKIASPDASDVTKTCRKLAECVRMGSAFHHAGLKPQHRKIIEDNFRGNLIKVIASTPTLAAGVNLPARRAIIRDVKRFSGSSASAYIPTSEYKQCAGRAGRPQYDPYGEAVLIAKNKAQVQTLFDRYINAQPEPIVSKLNQEQALRFHILASIAGEYVHNINDMFEFLNHTFLAHQKKGLDLIGLVGKIFEFLAEEELIEQNGFRFVATPFGHLISRLYIDPMSGIILREGLQKLDKGKSFSPVGLLHLINCLPDSETMHLSKTDQIELEEFAGQFEDQLIFTPEEDEDFFADITDYLTTIKSTALLYYWTDELKEEALCDQFSVGPGDVFRHTEAAQRLLYAASGIAELFGWRKFTFIIEKLRSRVRYGIKEELLSLVSLKGVGRVRARSLFNAGIHKMSDLKSLAIEDLAQVDKIGPAVAQDILDQLK